MPGNTAGLLTLNTIAYDLGSEMSIVLSAEFWSAKGQDPCLRVVGSAIGTDQDQAKYAAGCANER